jgi:hypothetical protein
MIKIKYILYISVLTLCMACDDQIGQEGIGWLRISKPTNDLVLETRATETNEIDYLVSISQGEESVMGPTLFSTIDGAIPLTAGTGYSVFAESCSLQDAESLPTVYGQPRYTGSASFNIVAGQQTPVKVACSMANAAFQVVKDASFYYTSYTVTATYGERTLTFTDEAPDAMGYFNVPAEGTVTLNCTVMATDADGNTGSGSATLQLQRRNLSKLNLKANPLGSINVTISYDDTFTPVVTNIVLPE